MRDIYSEPVIDGGELSVGSRERKLEV